MVLCPTATMARGRWITRWSWAVRICPGGHLKFVHDDVLAPGVSIGLHTHIDDEEYYYILEGRGVMTLDGERFEVQAGDITAVYPGGEHWLENTSDADLRMIVVCTS